MTEKEAVLIYGKENDPATPVIIAFHGIGASEQDLVPAFESFHSMATLVHPRGPLQSSFGYAWYQLKQIGVPEPSSFAGALATVDHWVEYAQWELGKTAEQIYLTGFSQGSILSLSYALLNPGKVHGVLGFSGYIPQSVLAETQEKVYERPLHIFLTHGSRDQMFPLRTLEETVAQLKERGHEVQAVSHSGGHEIPYVAIEAAKQWFEGEGK